MLRSRFLLILLVLTLILGAALAQEAPAVTQSPDAAQTPAADASPEATPPVTKEATISLEGMEEPVTLTLFESELGYSLWYDANLFALVKPDEQSAAQQVTDTFAPAIEGAIPGVSLTIHPDSQADVSLSDAGEAMLKTMQDGGFTVTQLDTSTLFPQYEALGFHGVSSEGVMEQYLLQFENARFILSLSYPQEAAEGFGARLYYLISTFEPAKAE
jgi:hypothetical protein